MLKGKMSLLLVGSNLEKIPEFDKLEENFERMFREYEERYKRDKGI